MRLQMIVSSVLTLITLLLAFSLRPAEPAVTQPEATQPQVEQKTWAEQYLEIAEREVAETEEYASVYREFFRSLPREAVQRLNRLRYMLSELKRRAARGEETSPSELEQIPTEARILRDYLKEHLSRRIGPKTAGKQLSRAREAVNAAERAAKAMQDAGVFPDTTQLTGAKMELSSAENYYASREYVSSHVHAKRAEKMAKAALEEMLKQLEGKIPEEILDYLEKAIEEGRYEEAADTLEKLLELYFPKEGGRPTAEGAELPSGLP